MNQDNDEDIDDINFVSSESNVKDMNFNSDQYDLICIHQFPLVMVKQVTIQYSSMQVQYGTQCYLTGMTLIGMIFIKINSNKKY